MEKALVFIGPQFDEREFFYPFETLTPLPLETPKKASPGFIFFVKLFDFVIEYL